MRGGIVLLSMSRPQRGTAHWIVPHAKGQRRWVSEKFLENQMMPCLIMVFPIQIAVNWVAMPLSLGPYWQILLG